MGRVVVIALQKPSSRANLRVGLESTYGSALPGAVASGSHFWASNQSSPVNSTLLPNMRSWLHGKLIRTGERIRAPGAAALGGHRAAGLVDGIPLQLCDVGVDALLLPRAQDAQPRPAQKTSIAAASCVCRHKRTAKDAVHKQAAPCPSSRDHRPLSLYLPTLTQILLPLPHL